MANRIRALRKARKWTLQKLADESGVSYAQVSRIERGVSGYSPDSLAQIAACFGLGPGDVLGEEDRNSPEIQEAQRLLAQMPKPDRERAVEILRTLAKSLAPA